MHIKNANKISTDYKMEKHEYNPITGETLSFLRLMITGISVVLGGSFHFGYQISLINPLADVLQAFIERDLKRTANTISILSDESTLVNALWATVAGILFIGALLGALVAPTMLWNIGAKRSLLFSSLVLCSTFILTIIAKFVNGPFLFIFARFLSGIGIGFATTVQTVYLSEISPVRHRGLMGTLTGFSTSVGFVIASGIGMPQILGTEQLWHYAYAIEAIPSIFLAIVLLTFLEESPIYSMRCGRTENALYCIRLYHSNPIECKARIIEITSELPAVQMITKSSTNICSSLMNFSKILKTRSSRSALLICMLLNTTVSFSGILAISFFGTFLLQEIGFSDHSAALANCVASFSGILGNLAGSFAIDRVGRRKLIIGGLFTLAILNISLMGLVFAFQYTQNINLGYGFLAVFMFFLFAFSCGVGPMAWFLATELTTNEARPHIQSASVACQYATCFLSPLIFFPLYHRGGGASFLVFIVPLIFTAVYLYAHLPETRDRAIHEIVQTLNGKRANKFCEKVNKRGFSIKIETQEEIPQKSKLTSL